MKQLPSLGIELYNQAPKILALSILTTCIWWGGLAMAQAQEAPPADAATSEIRILPPLTDQIQDLKAQYRSELEAYRNLDKQSGIANQQYEQLNTLLSLETAVMTMKKAMLSRVTVLDLYLRLLRLELLQSTGIEVTSKQALENDLDAAIEKLATHKTRVEAADDRASLNAITEEFVTLGPELESVAYETQSQLAQSRLQSVYDKVQVVKSEVRLEVSSNSAVLQQAALERAFAETDRNLDQVLAELNESQMLITKQEEFGANTYRSITSNLDEVFTGLTQSLNFLSELAGISTNDR